MLGVRAGWESKGGGLVKTQKCRGKFWKILMTGGGGGCVLGLNNVRLPSEFFLQSAVSATESSLWLALSARGAPPAADEQNARKERQSKPRIGHQT